MKLFKKTVCILLVSTLIICSVSVGSFAKAKNCPTVFVHGFSGWGDNLLQNVVNYWGFGYDIIGDLNKSGEECYEAVVGPFSSAWDRACELYAQLTGTTVDYGEAHSKAHNHARFGKAYAEPFFEGWGANKKINLIGHSFGGATVRLFAQLMKDGDAAERQASGNKVSGLFTGGKADYINGISAISAPHNGTTVVCALAAVVPTAKAVLAGVYAIFGKTPLVKVFDLYLSQFGVDSFKNGVDDGFYDLSPEGAAQLNERLTALPNVRYLSYATVVTHKSRITGNQVPDSSAALYLSLTGLLIGSCRGCKSGMKYSDEWRANDGMVNTVSCLYPYGEPYKDFAAGESLERGVWYVMPITRCDHNGLVGSAMTREEANSFYLKMISLLG